MTTLTVRGAGGAKLLTWVLSDGTSELGTGRRRLTSDTMEIDLRGRRLTARRPGSGVLDVTDDATGQTLIRGKLLASSDSPRYREWAVTLPSGATLTWFYQGEPRKLGYYNYDGAPVILQGHDPSFEVPRQVQQGWIGTLRILLSFWKGAVTSSNRYRVHVDDDAVRRVAATDEVSILALLGPWLQAEVEVEEPSGSGV
jgi:hypothetical protein